MAHFDPSKWTNEAPVYKKSPLVDLRGNPLVEALHTIPDGDKQTLLRMTVKPQFHLREIKLPSATRMLCVDRLHNFFFANPKHVEILQDIYAAVLNGYREKNPLEAKGQRKMHALSSSGCPAGIYLLTGPSGTGKSSLTRVVQEYFGAAVIAHSTYNGIPLPEKQIPFLRINLPDNCSTKAICEGLCRLVNKLLGVNHYEREAYNTSVKHNIIQDVKYFIRCYHVGAIIIDEIQHLSHAKSGGKEGVIAFLNNLQDEIGVPVILVGTYAACNLLQDSASTARRLVVNGYSDLARWESADDAEWLALCQVLWRYQWLADPCELSDEIISKLYEYSQGITAILIALFIRAQKTALRNKIESIDGAFLTRTYLEQLTPLHGIIDALRSNNQKALCMYEDLYIKQRHIFKVDKVEGRLDELNESITAEMDMLSSQAEFETHQPKPKGKGRKAKKSIADALQEVVSSHQSV